MKGDWEKGNTREEDSKNMQEGNQQKERKTGGGGGDSGTLGQRGGHSFLALIRPFMLLRFIRYLHRKQSADSLLLQKIFPLADSSVSVDTKIKQSVSRGLLESNMFTRFVEL